MKEGIFGSEEKRWSVYFEGKLAGIFDKKFEAQNKLWRLEEDREYKKRNAATLKKKEKMVSEESTQEPAQDPVEESVQSSKEPKDTSNSQTDEANLRSKVFSGLKKFGSGVVTAGSGVVVGAKAVKTANDKQVQREQKAKNWVGKKKDAFVDKVSGLEPFFFFALATHIFDAYNKFERGQSEIRLMGMLYFILTFYGIMFVYHLRPFSSEAFQMFAVSLFAFFVPFVLKSMSSPVMIAVLSALPIWCLWIIKTNQESEMVRKMGRSYGYIVLVAAVVLGITVGFSEGGRTLDSFDSGGEILKYYLVDNTVNFIKTFDEIPKKLIDAFNNRLNPKYAGQTKNEAPKGIFIENMRSPDSKHYENLPVTIYADMIGYEFPGLIVVDSRCYIDHKNGPIFGSMFPDRIEVYKDIPNTLECSFDGLPKGSHRVKFVSTFNFEVSSNIKYVFVDKLRARGTDINAELDIPRQITQSDSTNTPAKLSLSAKSLPIIVDSDRNEIPTPFGLSLENNWANGQVDFVSNLIVEMPGEIRLEGCYPRFETPILGDTNIYQFKISSPEKSFVSVSRCKMIVDNPAGFVGSLDSVTRTIKSEADYQYTIKEEFNIAVS